MKHILSLMLACALASPVAAADIHFCWLGANGYSLTGQMTVADGKMSNAVLTEDDVTRFKIVGYRDNQPIGTWTSAQRTNQTTWHMRFDPVGMTFLTGDRFSTTHSQGWNANGQVQDCGSPGFGFNSGNYAQDICLNGEYVQESSVPPETPLRASFAPFGPDCATQMPMSKGK